MVGRTVTLETLAMHCECVQFFDAWIQIIEVLCCYDKSVKAD
jgi:hypothetical protein